MVDPAPSGTQLAVRASTDQNLQDYLERVAKYVPAEVIAAYLTLLPVVLGSTQADSTRRTVWLAVIFGLGLVFTPLYLSRFPAGRHVKLYHFAVSTTAFVVWAYSIKGGLFDDVGVYDTIAAAVTIVVFTLMSGLAVPPADPSSG